MSSAATLGPRHRLIVGVDVERSTERNNIGRARLRQDMYDLLEGALLDAGIGSELRDPVVDRGDGAMVLIRPEDSVPKTLLLNTLMPRLKDALASHNAAQPRQAFRLRVALHAGDVHYDDQGTFGEDIDIMFRLLDAPALRAKLGQTSEPMVLVVSNSIYQSVVRHGYDGIDEATFDPVVAVSVGARFHYGWVSLLSRTVEQAWPFQSVTGFVHVDRLLHLAGQELDSRAAVKALDPTAVIDELFRAERDELPGAG